MTSNDPFETRFRESLRGLGLDAPEIRVYPADFGGYKYFGRVISRSFEGQYEGQRQARVWGHLLDAMSPDDQSRVEFVYTDTPAEWSERTR